MDLQDSSGGFLVKTLETAAASPCLQQFSFIFCCTISVFLYV